MHCPRCNRIIPDTVRFCAYCGASLQPQLAPAGRGTTRQISGLVAAITVITVFLLTLGAALVLVKQRGPAEKEVQSSMHSQDQRPEEVVLSPITETERLQGGPLTDVGGAVTDIASSPISGSEQSQEAKWSQEIELWHILDVEIPVTSIAFSPDGEMLAASSMCGDLTFWRVKDGKRLRTYEDLSCSVPHPLQRKFSPDWNLVTLHGQGLLGGVRISKVSGDDLSSIGSLDVTALAADFSPDGDTLATGALRDFSVRLWELSDAVLRQLEDAETSEERDKVLDVALFRSLTDHIGWITSLAFSPDGHVLASGSADQTVKLWQIPEGSLVNTLEGHNGTVWGLAFSPDGQLLASGGRTVRVWRVPDGTLLRTLKAHEYSVRSLDFSPDGDLLASGSEDGTVNLWRVSDGALLRTLKHEEYVYSVAFSPDGNILASGAIDVKLWKLQ